MLGAEILNQYVSKSSHYFSTTYWKTREGQATRQYLIPRSTATWLKTLKSTWHCRYNATNSGKTYLNFFMVDLLYALSLLYINQTIIREKGEVSRLMCVCVCVWVRREREQRDIICLSFLKSHLRSFSSPQHGQIQSSEPWSCFLI